MALLHEALWRSQLRQVLRSHGIGTMRRDDQKGSYRNRQVYTTKYTDGFTIEGRQLLRLYKNATKEAKKWMTWNKRRHFYVSYQKPTLTMPGWLEVVYMSSENQDYGEEL